MISLTPADVAALISEGHHVCHCGAILKPDASECRWCGTPLSPAAAPEAAASPPRKERPKKRKAAFNPDRGRGASGSLAQVPGQELCLVVAGVPIQQGSLKAVAAGVIRRESGPDLVAWRDKITREALRVCGSTWVPSNAPVRVDVVFTVPRPTSLPSQAVPADGYRDLDKLERAVGDALCPNDASRFRVLASDMRITEMFAAKTHPRPHHTHQWALDQPGAVIRVSALGAGEAPINDPVPVSTDPIWRSA